MFLCMAHQPSNTLNKREICRESPAIALKLFYIEKINIVFSCFYVPKFEQLKNLADNLKSLPGGPTDNQANILYFVP